MKWRQCRKRIIALLNCLVVFGLFQIISVHWTLSPTRHARPARPGGDMASYEKPGQTMPSIISMWLPEGIISDLNTDIRASLGPTRADETYDIINVTGSDSLLRDRRNLYHKHLDINMHSVTYPQLQRALARLSDCPFVRDMRGREYVGSGWTKLVSRGYYRGRLAAHKTLHWRGHDLKQCSEGLTDGGMSDCYKRASLKLMKETILLRHLRHPNIIKLLGFCVPSMNADDSRQEPEVSLVTSLGTPVDLIELLQMPWEERLRICLGVTRLVSYLANSPYGSLALHDFRRQQFVLVNGHIVLTDLDDLDFREPSCHNDTDCSHVLSGSDFRLQSSCVHNSCVDYNEKKNIYNAGRHFTTFLLPHGSPAALRLTVDRLVARYSDVSLGATHLLDMIEDIVHVYSSGSYRNNMTIEAGSSYDCFNDTDLPGMFDYPCHVISAGGTCSQSVLDIREAQQFCDVDPRCQAFVISKSERTWTGRYIAYFKSNVSSPATNQGTTLCIRGP